MRCNFGLFVIDGSLNLDNEGWKPTDKEKLWSKQNPKTLNLNFGHMVLVKKKVKNSFCSNNALDDNPQD